MADANRTNAADPLLDDKLAALLEPVAVPTDPVLRVVTQILSGLMTILCLAWVLSVPQYLGTAFYTEQLLALVLGLAISIAYYSVNFRGTRQRGFPHLDIVLGTLGLAVGIWVSIHYPRLLLDVAFRTPEVLIISGIMILLVLEALRRCTGWALLGVVLFFLAYAMVAHLAPIELRGRPVNPGPLAVYLAFDPSAVFGTPLAIGTTIVMMYLWMGEVLFKGGGGEFFNDICIAFFGKSRGGPAKICVVGSALFGMISGSAVSNVVSSGVFTIPMMRKTGYSARDAGAIEAVSSTGGQLMPPVMGAAAFLMAEFLEVPYADVAIAAAFPAVLYYWGEYITVDLMAGRDRLLKYQERIPKVLYVMKEGWHFLPPFALLLFTMFYWDESPEVAAVMATVAMLLGGMVKTYHSTTGQYRLKIFDLWHTLSSCGRTTTDLILTLAAAGFVIGVLNITGLGFALTLWLVKLGGDSLIVLLLVTALVSVILGMGMPTTAVYVLLAALAAPSLVQAGVPKMAAHMFILYFGMLSMVTPPVALAAYAAANISKAGVMETGLAACKIGWTAFVIPFLFVLSPTLLMYGDTISIIADCATAMFGVYYVTAGIVGWFYKDFAIWERALLVISGMMAVIPDSVYFVLFPHFVSICGVVIGAAILAPPWFAARRVEAKAT